MAVTGITINTASQNTGSEIITINYTINGSGSTVVSLIFVKNVSGYYAYSRALHVSGDKGYLPNGAYTMYWNNPSMDIGVYNGSVTFYLAYFDPRTI